LCDAALLYYGAGSELWLRQKLREVQKAAAYGRSGPIAHRAIYLAPPDSPQKQRFRTHEALVLPATEVFTPAALAPFLRLLAPGAGVAS
jgi:hypothetical protein